MLGKGKFASVFQGSWENCQVAIKALHPYCSDQAVKDFRREAEILRFLIPFTLAYFSISVCPYLLIIAKSIRLCKQ